MCRGSVMLNSVRESIQMVFRSWRLFQAADMSLLCWCQLIWTLNQSLQTHRNLTDVNRSRCQHVKNQALQGLKSLKADGEEERNQGAWGTLFLHFTVMNVTGVLRVDLERVRNYWIIRSLGLVLASDLCLVRWTFPYMCTSSPWVNLNILISVKRSESSSLLEESLRIKTYKRYLTHFFRYVLNKKALYVYISNFYCNNSTCWFPLLCNALWVVMPDDYIVLSPSVFLWPQPFNAAYIQSTH